MSTYQDLLDQIAEDDAVSVPTGGGFFSGGTYQDVAQISAEEAAASAEASADSAAAALASENAVGDSADEAANSASNAATSEANAATSEANAEAAAAGTGGYADAAAASAAEALASETEAALSEGAAFTSEANAASSSSSASGSATDAETAETGAQAAEAGAEAAEAGAEAAEAGAEAAVHDIQYQMIHWMRTTTGTKAYNNTTALPWDLASIYTVTGAGITDLLTRETSTSGAYGHFTPVRDCFVDINVLLKMDANIPAFDHVSIFVFNLDTSSVVSFARGFVNTPGDYLVGLHLPTFDAEAGELYGVHIMCSDTGDTYLLAGDSTLTVRAYEKRA